VVRLAGTLSLSAERRWSAASWLFYWVLRELAQEAMDPDLTERINEVIDENLGWFSLEDLSEKQQMQTQHVLRDSLVDSANREFSDTMPGRKEAIDHLRDLAAMASHT
jgi:hypothetical protein